MAGMTNEEILQSESAQKQICLPDLNQHEYLWKRFIKLGSDVPWESKSVQNKQDKNESTLSLMWWRIWFSEETSGTMMDCLDWLFVVT